VLSPLIQEDKLGLYLIKLIHNQTMKSVNTQMNFGVKDTSVLSPQKLKMLFDLTLVDTSCNEKNIFFLGDSMKFLPDAGLANTEKEVIDNLKAFLLGCINDKQEVTTAYEICTRYIELITGVYNSALQGRIVAEIQVHLEKFTRVKLKQLCYDKFQQLNSKPLQDICEVIITEDYIQQSEPFTLGNQVRQFVDEFMAQADCVYGKEYFLKGILYFLRSTFCEVSERWLQVVCTLADWQH
jgi:hypothetical protein